MTRWLLGGMTAAVLAAAVWQLGQGLYIHSKAWVAQRLLDRAWAETVASEARHRPWPWADTWPVARLRVPRLGRDLIVLEGASGATMAFAPGHLHGSSLPGRPGNSVISAHRDTHFRWLRGLRQGDHLEVQRPDGAVRVYEVISTRVVDAREARLRLAGSVPRLTLVTCYPFDAATTGGPLRYVVEARARAASTDSETEA